MLNMSHLPARSSHPKNLTDHKWPYLEGVTSSKSSVWVSMLVFGDVKSCLMAPLAPYHQFLPLEGSRVRQMVVKSSNKYRPPQMLMNSIIPRGSMSCLFICTFAYVKCRQIDQSHRSYGKERTFQSRKKNITFHAYFHQIQEIRYSVP